MKNDKDCPQLEGFSPALSSGDFEYLKLPGMEKKARLIHKLFELGKGAEARKVLREVLTELMESSKCPGNAKASRGTKAAYGKRCGKTRAVAHPLGSEPDS